MCSNSTNANSISNANLPDVTDLLGEMVAFNTVNAGISNRNNPEFGLLEHLKQVAEKHGLSPTKLAVNGQCHNLLISFERAPHLPWILFDCHVDTVSEEGMTVAPFIITLQNNRLSGRGACDAKGSGAAMLSALIEYSKLPNGSNNVMLLFSVDEEVGMSGIWSFVRHDLANLPKFIGSVIGEPTQLLPIIAHNGVLRHKITTFGVAAHSSDTNKGVSAISRMAELILALENEFIPTLSAESPLTGKAQFSINQISGGNAINTIPNRCEIHIDRRIIPGETIVSAEQEITSFLKKYCLQHQPVIDFEIIRTAQTPSLSTEYNEPFIHSIIQSIKRNKRLYKPVGVPYATHAGVLSSVGIPSVVLGPGSIDQAHTKDEWIDRTELMDSVKIFRDIMQNC
jgi:acetylornithine deacetylase